MIPLGEQVPDDPGQRTSVETVQTNMHAETETTSRSKSKFASFEEHEGRQYSFNGIASFEITGGFVFADINGMIKVNHRKLDKLMLKNSSQGNSRATTLDPGQTRDLSIDLVRLYADKQHVLPEYAEIAEVSRELMTEILAAKPGLSYLQDYIAEKRAM